MRKKNNIYCVCNKASNKECDRCVKGRTISPYACLYYDKWKRNVKKY